jgi:hypothetical protein
METQVQPITQKSTPMVTTYSMWRLFRNCRTACDFRYNQELEPIERDPNLAFGSLVHQALELWHRTRNLDLALDRIDRAYPNRSQDPDQRADWHRATAMMQGYATCYPEEDFEVIDLEKTFEGRIYNPATGAASRTFKLAGKVDGIVKLRGEYHILEHKTVSLLDDSYLDRLWTDFQVTLYAHYVEKTLGIPIKGIIYNILVKARLQQGKGETEIEFEERRAALAAKSKSGTSSAKRKLPESDEDFHRRLLDKYAEPTMFHREMLYLSRDQFVNLQSELWELTQAMKDAMRRGTYYQNTAYCFHYGRPCAYYPLCRAGSNRENVLENFYQKRQAHEELLSGPDSEC